MNWKMFSKGMYRFLVLFLGFALIVGVASCSAPSTPTATPTHTYAIIFEPLYALTEPNFDCLANNQDPRHHAIFW